MRTTWRVNHEPDGACDRGWRARRRVVAGVLMGALVVVGPVAMYEGLDGVTSVRAFQVCPNPVSGCTAGNHNQVLL
jgi:hypothetical protein